ncbi:hypothetical protein V6N13_090722 [Hibiscus sabdariffa]
MEVNSKSGSNLTKVMWKVEILKAVDCSKSHSTGVAKKEFKAKVSSWGKPFVALSELQNPKRGYLLNDACIVEAYISTDRTDCLISRELILETDLDKHKTKEADCVNAATHNQTPMKTEPITSLSTGPDNLVTEVNNKFGSNLPKVMLMVEILKAMNDSKEVAHAQFNETMSGWGEAAFLPLGELHDPERGYLVNDVCLVEAYVSTDYSEGIISYELILDTDSDKHEAFEPEEPSEENIKTFFSSLESELSSSDSVISKEEAKEALAKLDEAMNMTPVDFYNSGKFSPLKQAFKILASFDCFSTALTIEQINELLAMEESLKELADRAARVVQNKNRLTENESIKLTITRNLGSNLIRYKEVESEVKQVEQKLAAFHEQVEEAQKARENMLGERKGIFRSSKRMKVELEALERKRAEYEAEAEVAEKEEKTVEAEWGRMKDFISSIKGKI